MSKKMIFAALLLMLAIVPASVFASEAKPFAEKHVVLQISDPNPFKQTLVLNVANNIIKHYGADKVEVEIVAFGPGLRLLTLDNTNTNRIKSLSSEGVRFSACQNTIKAFTKQLGHEPQLNPAAVSVSAGVVRIMDLVAQNYTLVKP